MTEEITLNLEPGLVDTDFIAKVEISPRYAEELKRLLKEQGLEASDYMQKDLGVGLAIIVVFGGLAKALAPALRDFYHRHDGKVIKTRVNGEPLETQGLSLKEFERVANDLEKRKKENQEQYDASIEEMEKPEG